MTKRDDGFGNKAEAFEAFDDIPTNPHLDNTIGDVINARYDRRGVLRGMLAVSASTALFGATALTAPTAARATDRTSRYAFSEIEAGVDEFHHIADGYNADILLRWGDPIFADAPEFDPQNQTRDSQLAQFGYNNDYCGYIALSDDRGLLCVNHEYTNEELMFPGLGRQDRTGFDAMTRELVEIEMAAHGGTIVEIARGDDGKWSVDRASRYNRRITPLTTKMSIDGPAAGHDRLKTNEDPSGKTVIGTLNNCAGGMTPWGTYLMAEENFHGYFWTDKRDGDGKPVLDGEQARSMKRYSVPGGWYAWGRYFDRFNVDKEPNEPNRFGYVVEVDPHDPTSMPVKHTALGRFRHEGCETAISADGRVVVYSGDDNRFDYVYKFVSDGRISDDRAANMRLLSAGTLYVARFNEDGVIDWLPLVAGTGPLNTKTGFPTQAEVCIDTRIAADLMGATPMDRPEDVQPGPDGRVFCMLTNNRARKYGGEHAANPRSRNTFGHIIEIREDGEDAAATSGRWDIVVKCGDPAVAEIGAEWHPETSADGWFASPDNAAMDAMGRLWVCTDQGSRWVKTGKSDGLYGLETEGAARGVSKLFFRCPVGAEMCGPYFTDDLDTLFLAVQHPAADGVKSFPGFERYSTFEDPATRWPDFQEGVPPRPSVMVVTKQGGGRIAV